MTGAGSTSVAVIRPVRPGDLADLPVRVQDMLRAQEFAGEPGQRALMTADDLEIFVGVGAEASRQAVRVAVSRLGLARGSRVRVEPPGMPRPERVVDLLRAELVAADYDLADWESSSARAHEVEGLALRRAREWTNASGAALTPPRFAEMARELAESVGLRADVWDESRLEQERCGAILAVGQGSTHGTRLVDLLYDPPGAPHSVTLIGKGVTFDTGGLSLKSPAAMASMRMDKVGVATVLAVMSVLPDLGLNVRVKGLLPLAENMIGPDAVKPGDVVVGRSGVPITIMDTDFEGRVLMSDALTLACEASTDCVIDIAALTYQVAIALGNEIAGLFTNDDGLAGELARAGAVAGEEMWRLPLARCYQSQVRLGDGVKNHPESDVGRAITAALFLEHFVRSDVPWAHLDITGPAWSGPASEPGATGYGVRTLLEFLRAKASST